MNLDCSNIVFFYPGNPVPVLKDLCLRLDRPGFHALFGPSGVGKTSLAKIMAGGLESNSGHIRIEGIKNIFYTHNQERLPDWSSVGRHLKRVTPAGKVFLKDELVEKFGLSAYLNQRFSQLSLGQQNRINLLRYLVQYFQVLIMDESLANVDEKTRGHIVLTIKEMFPDVIFLYISHNAAEVAKYCSQIRVLRSALKEPQVIDIQGRDHQAGQDTDLAALQETMLELVNAV